MIDLTVGIPMYKASEVAWLALESLCRQKDIDFDWELIVVEEQTDEMVGDIKKDYGHRLANVGCAKISHIVWDRWRPLSEKWKTMGSAASPSSEAFVLCGADDWNNPRRLKEAHDLIVTYGADWVQYEAGYYYDLIDEKVVRFDGKKYFRGMSINALVGKSLKTRYMRNLVGEAKTKVDTWLMENMLTQNPYCYTVLNRSKDGDKAVYTYGANYISARHDEIRNYKEPFYKSFMHIDAILPEEVVKKLKGIKTREDKERMGYELKQ